MRLSDLDIRACQDAMAPNEARFWDGEYFVSAPLFPRKEVRVGWGPFSGPQERLNAFYWFLRYFTWPTNADHPTVEKRYVAGDAPDRAAFRVQHVDYYGRWRQAGVSLVRREPRPNEVEYYLVLTLRAGYAETLAWDEAEAIDYAPVKDAGATPAQSLLVRWYNVSPHKFKSTCTSGIASSATVTSPVIGSETYTGTWRNMTPRAVRVTDDGSAMVEMRLVRTYALTATTASAIRDEMALRTQRILRHDNEIAHLLSISTFEEDTLLVEYPNFPWHTDESDPTSYKKCMVTLTDADIADNAGDNALLENLPDSGYGWSYLKRQWVEKEDGTASLVLVVQKRAFNQYSRTKDESWETNIEGPVARDYRYRYDGTDTETESITVEWIRVDKDRLAVVLAAAQDIDNYREYDDAGEVGTWDILSSDEDGDEWIVQGVSIRRAGNGGADVVATITNTASDEGWFVGLYPRQYWQEVHDFPDRVTANNHWRRRYVENHHVYYGFSENDAMSVDWVFGGLIDIPEYTDNATDYMVPPAGMSYESAPAPNASYWYWRIVQVGRRRVGKNAYEVHYVIRVNEKNYVKLGTLGNV